MSFAIQYPGDSCNDCGEELLRGQQATYFEGGVVHLKCPPKTEVCTSCFQAKSVTGACGCDD